MKQWTTIFAILCVVVIHLGARTGIPVVDVLEVNVTIAATPACFGDSATVFITPTGGTAPYEVTLNGVLQTIFTEGESAEFELPSGAFDLMVTDALGEAFNEPLNIVQPAAFSLNLLGVGCETEVGVSADGWIEVEPVGGTAPYLYEWSAPPVNTFPILEGLTHQESYSLTITDANGCVDSLSGITVGVHEPIVSNNYPACQGDTLTFLGSPTVSYGENLSGHWQTPSGFVIEDQLELIIPNAALDDSGIYTLVLENEYGCSSNPYTAAATVIDPIYEIGVSANVCDGTVGEIFVQSEPSTSTFSYQWTPAFGLDCPECPVALVDIDQTTTYTVTASDNLGYCTEVDSVTVEYFNLPIPTVIATPPTTICEGEDVLLECLLDLPGYVFEWTGPNGFNSTECDLYLPAITTTQSGIYCLTMTTPEGCMNVTCIDLFIVSNPLQWIELLPDSVCSGESAQLNVVTNNALSYAWTGPNLSDVNVANPICFPEAPSATYTVAVVSIDGCLGVDSVTVYVDEDCVWPGDTDSSGTVNNFDLLNIGLAYDSTGAPRPNANLGWTGQRSPDWDSSFPNGSNYKHADTDGNGLVNSDDTLAITLNWGLTHNFQPPLEEKGLNTPFYIEPDTLLPNTPYSLEVILGDQDNPANDIYGLAFSIIFDPEVIVPGTANMSISPSWLGNLNEDLIMIQKSFHPEGRLDVGITRIDAMNIGGSGEIGRFNIIVEDIIFLKGSNLEKDLQETIFSIENVRVIDAEGGEKPVNNTPTTAPILSAAQEALLPRHRIRFAPNPAEDYVEISTGGLEVRRIELVDQLGRTRQWLEPKSAADPLRFEFNTTGGGLFLLKVFTNEGIWVDQVHLR